MPSVQNPQDDLYKDANDVYGAALSRLARAWEADPDAQQDLLQEMHLALWRSFATFDGRCSLRTWIYRVAHNAAASHVKRSRRGKSTPLMRIEELEESREMGSLAAKADTNQSVEQNQILDRLYELIHRLNPIDRQVILLYLEGMDAASIGEVTGLSSGYVATKIHRIKTILAERFHNGGNHDRR
jgi:RNA polymerase sigma-70 factor (ECF subfamily)